MAIPPVTKLDRAAVQDLWVVVLASAGPLLWFADLCGAYAISTHECSSNHAPLSWTVTLTSALLTTGALVACARMRRRAAPRARAFLIQASLMLNALALLLLLGFAAPLALLRPCD